VSNVNCAATIRIDIDQLNKELISHLNKGFTSFLLPGLREGFDTGISELPHESFECQNLRFAIRDPVSVTSLVNEELNKGYLIGPYGVPTFRHYRINAIGLAESKYLKKKRLIVGLSAPRNDADHPSLNSLIDKESSFLFRT
jgi:hypothetical protein